VKKKVDITYKSCLTKNLGRGIKTAFERTILRGGLVFLLCLAMCLITACSTKNNTSGTRAWHSFMAKYNTLSNGQIAFQEGLDAQLRGHQDDYSNLLPIYISTKKATAGLGNSNYETAIEKAEKAIKLHTIKKKPVMSGGKLSAKEREFRNRKEFNPALKKAWLMMGKAQFNQGEFIEAASTFNYIIQMYSTQPEVSSVAKAWLARCYVALEWPYDAEDLLNKMRRDTMTVQSQREKDNTMAGFLILAERYEEAIPYLKETIKHTRGKLQRARLNYLLGQLYNELGDSKMAYKYLGKVTRSNPPYEMEFNARIMQTEVMSEGQSKKMIKKLNRMARSERNKDYLDRVYYAIGNIYMSTDDTTRCIAAWEKGIDKSTKSGPAKAMLLLRLGRLYWDRENYIDAQRCYQQCIGILDKEHEEYKETERRSKILDEVAPPLSDVKLQDSLQVLAKLPEAELFKAIDRVIEELKKKEKEEAKKAAAMGQTPGAPGVAGANQQNANAANRQPQTNMGMNQQKGAWYFYNPLTVQNGKQEFQRRWGQRANEDNWRRSNKRVEKNDDFEEYDYGDEDEEMADSLGIGDEGTEDDTSDEEKALQDSLANDPHQREYYLKQIPFTEEQLQSSNMILSEGLYKAGVLEVEKVENFPLALKTLLRLLNDFPEYEKKEDVYYHLFLLTGRMGDSEEAERYKTLITEEYPEGKIAALLNNPNYVMIATQGTHVEDSLYSDAYKAYMEDRYEVVEENYKFCTDNFPEGKNRAKLLFVHAMTQLYTEHRQEFMEELKELVQKYPQDEITEMAKSIVKGLEEGRLLSGDKYDATGIWGRRTASVEGDSTAIADTLKADRFTNFNFVLAYPTDSLNQDQLLFELARFNFTNFMVRNFDIELMDLSGISMMVVHGFLSYDEVHAYAQNLYNHHHMATILQGIRTVLISDDNLKMLGRQYSFDDYAEFFDKTFAPLVIPKNLNIDETDIPFVDPDDYVPEEETEEEILDDSSNSYDWLF